MIASKKLKISGTGCALVDYLYKPVNFNDPDFKKYLSVVPGDGGLSPGKLVFSEEFEKFSGEPYLNVREAITKGKKPIALNIGGPSIVSLIHAAQILHDLPVDICFYGCKGPDEGGSFIENKLLHTPLKIGHYKTGRHYSPFTDVLSDPDFEGGTGERIFLNNIGAAWEFVPSDLDNSFFESDIVVFGGTALVPNIHSALGELLKRVKVNKKITIVNTVYDFLSEKSNPLKPWPLGKSNDAYAYIDLLITDMEESLRLSGSTTVEMALNFFRTNGVGAVIVTHGSKELYFFSDNTLFGRIMPTTIPVSDSIRAELSQYPDKAGDTTGCGDNFAGGVIAYIARQMVTSPDHQINLKEAVALGVASGGFACFYNGGTFYEDFPGQKVQQLDRYYREYRLQIGLSERRAKPNKKLVLFGAGKIGRSFIGQVFSRSGYEVVFIDINQELINSLNAHRQYNVKLKSADRNETITITNVRGIHLSEGEKIISELASASIAALSVGQQGLPAALPIIARSLVLRQQYYGNWPIDIIIAENMRNADSSIREELCRLLPIDYPLDKLVGLVETSIGKMVPIITQKDIEEDPIQVFTEPYNTLIVSKNGFKNPLPEVIDLAPKENIKAWVDRKLFIHNLGHATAAYLGFKKNPKWVFIYEALADTEIFEATKETMLQSADILLALYPREFTFSHLEEHIEDLLERFQNKALGDTIFRVGCDLYRKLSPDDRLVAPINAAKKLNKPYDLIFSSLIAAISFSATDENGHYHPSDEHFFQEAEKGIDHLLENICGLQSRH
jgi:mannitol-1-phosphate 5-dehydrogenase